MRTAILAAFLPALVLCSACGKPAAPPPSAEPPPATVEGATTSVTGKVEIQAPGSESWKPLAVRDGIPEGARVRAGTDGEADLVLTNQGAVRLKPGTTIQVVENRVVNGTTQINVRVDAGRLLHRFRHLPANTSYHVSTPMMTAGIRGTQFDVTASSDHTQVRVLDGRVQVENAAGRVEVGEKQGTSASAGAAPAQPQQLSQADADAVLECSLVHFTVALQKARRMATQAEMRNITVPLEVWASTHDGKYPTSLAEGGADGYEDNWNSKYRYEVLNGGSGFVIISNGPDRAPDTEDDLEYRRE